MKNQEAAEEALAFLFGEKVQKSDVTELGKIVNVDEWNAGLTHPALLTAAEQLKGAGTADSFYPVSYTHLDVYKRQVVMVSHDRFFLDRTADVIYELAGGKLTRYAGNYSAYREQKLKRIRLQKKAYERCV